MCIDRSDTPVDPVQETGRTRDSLG